MRVSAQNTWPSLRWTSRPRTGWPDGSCRPGSTTRRSCDRGRSGLPTRRCCAGSCTQARSHRTRPPALRQAVRPSRTCSSRAAARPGSRPPWRGGHRRQGAAGRGGAPTGRPSALGHRGRARGPAAAGRAGGRRAGIEVLTNAVVLGRYDGNLIAVLDRGLPGGAERLIKARAKTLIVAPGLIERPYVFAGNDTAGRAAVHRRPPPDQPVRRPARRAGRGAGGQRRRRCGSG